VSSKVSGRRRPRLPFFRETFRNPERLARNGGVLTGALSVANGIVCDGVTLAGARWPHGIARLYMVKALTVYIRFTPTYAHDHGVQYTFFAGGNLWVDYWVRLLAGGNIRETFGGTSISDGNPSAAWLTGEENVLIISTTSGATSMWLNGVTLVNGSATAWSPKPSDVGDILEIGAEGDDTNPFAGTIHEVRFYDYAMDANEAADLYAGDELNKIKPQDALVWLPLTRQMGDGSAGDPWKTPNLGSLGSAADAFVGSDGLSATGDQPTKLSPKGYRFAAGTMQLRIPDQDALSFVSGGVDLPFSIVVIMRPDDPADGGQNRLVSKEKDDGSEIEYFLYFAASDLRMRLNSTDANAGGRRTNDDVDSGRLRVAAMTYDGSGVTTSGIKLYLDGKRSDTADNDAGAGYTAPMQTGDGDVAIGNNAGGSTDFTGDILEVQIWGKELSPTEVKALAADARARINLG